MKKALVIYFLIFLTILFFVYRSLIFNLSTNLPDWLDSAAVNWMIFQNVDKITSLQFNNYFDSNAFYPHKYSLLFADSFLPQALMELPFYLLTKNLLLSFNIIFLSTFVLDYLSSFLFWRLLFKNNFLAFLGGLFVVFSPFFHLEHGHSQMMFYWPFFLSLYFLFREKGVPRIKDALGVGIFLAIQFLASVYISIYLSFAIVLAFLFKLITVKTKLKLAKTFILIFFIFVALDGVFIKGYLDVKNTYHIKRDFSELVTYSAHVSDYLFTKNIDSLLHQSPFMSKWNSFDKNLVGGQASFPGFLLFFLSIFGIFKLTTNKQFLTINIDFKKERAFFLVILITSFISSFGPRLNFNGAYAYIPTPYDLVVKFIPFIEAARAPSRWAFLFYIALIYFSLIFLKKLQPEKYFKYIAGGIVLLFLLEYIPTNIQTHKEEYINSHYQLLKDICLKQKTTVLEFPVTHLDVYPTIGDGVNYIAKVELSSTYHKCFLVNGYSSYDMPSIFNLSSRLNYLTQTNSPLEFLNELKDNRVDVIKFNYSQITPKLRSQSLDIFNTLSTSSGVLKLDDQMLLIKHKQ